MGSDGAEDLRQRTKRFALRIVKLSQTLWKGKEARVLGDQLLRAGTAVAANYRAACRARSRAEFIAKLKATKEGSGTLLDHSAVLYGSGMGNPNVHDHINLPILVAGGAACGMKGGRHIRFTKPTPLANLHLTLLDKVGVRLDKFADSSGKVDGL